MILAVDIGNTNIVFGGYKDGKLAFCTRIATDPNLEADQYALQVRGILSLYHVEAETLSGAILSSVVPKITRTVARALRMFAEIEPLYLTQDLPTGVAVEIDNPAVLGADLLAAAVAVNAQYPLPAVIIDMGTATKITALDAFGAVQGVSIMPGLFISLDALTHSASLLGGISIEAPARAIGKNTADSMKSGVVFGAACMLDGMIDRFAAELGEVRTIIATGGAASCVVPHCKHEIILSDTLLLDGLYHVYQRAVQEA